MSSKYVYVVRQDKYVKIGLSNCPTRRLGQIGLASHKLARPEDLDMEASVKPVGAFLGDASTEAALHLAFSDVHVVGEWFRYEGRISEWCEQLISDYQFAAPFSVTPGDVAAGSSLVRAANRFEAKAVDAERRIVELTGAIDAWRAAASIIDELPEARVVSGVDL